MKAFETWVGILLMVIVLCLMVFINTIKDKKTECLRDSIAYGIKNIEESKSSKIICQCNSLDASVPPFIYTSEGPKPFYTTQTQDKTKLSLNVSNDTD